MSKKKERTPDEIELRRKILKKIMSLYFVQTNTFLLASKYTNNEFITRTKGKVSEKTGKTGKSLQDYEIYNHLDGYCVIGAKSGQFMNIFLSFDVDFSSDLIFCKWITQKISQTMNELGIEHHISFSGGKGYHIDVFFEDLVSRKIHKNLFEYILDQADVRQFMNPNNTKGFKTLEDGSIIELGNVEYRPSAGYGIKLPLGFHHKTKKFCGFIDINDNFRIMNREESYKYFLNIRRINSKDLVAEHFPELLTYTKINQFVLKEDLQKTEGTITRYNQPKYEQSEDEAIDEATDLLFYGLKYKNSRHNSIFKIAKLFKYNGMEEDKAKDELLRWMDQQPKVLYEATKDEATKDIINCINDVYKGSYTIKPPKKNIDVTYAEIIAIIDSCPRETEKLLTYSIHIHSKRWAKSDGKFYFTQEEMATASGLGISTVKLTLPKLEKLGILEYIKRDQNYDWDLMRKPKNEYRLLLKVNPEIVEVENKIYTTDRQDDLDKCLLNYFTIPELKKKLQRRHIEKLKEMDTG